MGIESTPFLNVVGSPFFSPSSFSFSLTVLYLSTSSPILSGINKEPQHIECFRKTCDTSLLSPLRGSSLLYALSDYVSCLNKPKFWFPALYSQYIRKSAHISILPDPWSLSAGPSLNHGQSSITLPIDLTLLFSEHCPSLPVVKEFQLLPASALSSGPWFLSHVPVAGHEVVIHIFLL